MRRSCQMQARATATGLLGSGIRRRPGRLNEPCVRLDAQLRHEGRFDYEFVVLFVLMNFEEYNCLD
jgi:hypothetical protein